MKIISSVILSLATSWAVASDNADTVHVLVYETEYDGLDSPAQNLMNQINNLYGFDATIFGHGKEFEGYGSKFSALLPILKNNEKFDSESLVVISDSRDVLVNNPQYVDTYVHTLVDEFKMSFEEITSAHPGAIIISAEAQCCVSALTHVAPGAYYNADGSRKEHSCSSGSEGCLWNGDDKALPWENFMKELMESRSLDEYEDMYLNAGLITGKVKDLIRVIEAAKIGNDEDDQAVLTDYMYRNSQDIVLDYDQKIFGNNRGGLNDMKHGGCIFDKHASGDRLVHTKTNTSPLFLHSPGGFFQCHDKLAADLGIQAASQVARRRLKETDRKLRCNYGRGKCDQSDENSDEEDERDGLFGGNILGNLLGNRGNDDDGEDSGGLFGRGNLFGREGRGGLFGLGRGNED